MDQLGCQLDVVAHDLLVLGDTIDVADTTSQVSVYAWAQLTLPELEGTKSLPTLAREKPLKTGPAEHASDQTERPDDRDQDVLFTPAVSGPHPETTACSPRGQTPWVK